MTALHIRKIWAVLLAGSVAASTIGCGQGSYAEKRFHSRLAGMERTGGMIARQEAKRPDKLERDAMLTERRLAKKVSDTHKNADELAQATETEFRRLGEKWPAIEREVARRLGGRPQNIERTAVRLFF